MINSLSINVINILIREIFEKDIKISANNITVLFDSYDKYS